jgi:hypothetical protein
MRYFLLSFITLLLAGGQSAMEAAPQKLAYPQYVHATATAVMTRLQSDNDYPAAIASLQSLFDQTILYTPDDRLECMREADFALRLARQLKNTPPATRNAVLPFLLKHENLASTLVFLVRPDHEKPTSVYALLNKLQESRGDNLEKYASLAAAICVVQHKPFTVHINENQVKSVDPVDIFDYYVKNENRMYFGIRNVPAELLVYVVDTTATISEMNWALDKYANTSNVGRLFFDIKYDYEYLKRGTDKTVTVKGYNLPNILKYGGICADQAYFATAVGKAIGVPTAYDTGSSGESAHAWVGFLQFNGKVGQWNFDSGRYEAYQGVRGNVLDPQSHQDIPDSYVSLLSEIIGTRTADRQTAVALTDAADRLNEIDKKESTAQISPPSPDQVSKGTFTAKARPTNTSGQLGLIELALKESVAYAPAWFFVRDLAVDKKLSMADKQHWSTLLLQLGAKKYPDFTLAVLMPMAQTIEDPQQRDTLLTQIRPLFASRMDLSASIIMAQAHLWESQNQINRAGQYFMEVVQRYTNSGPFVLAALTGAEKLLKTSGHADQISTLYGQAWSRTTKPDEMAQEFMQESNWFHIGKMYAKKLKEAGDAGKAEDVESKLGMTPKAASK